MGEKNGPTAVSRRRRRCFPVNHNHQPSLSSEKIASSISIGRRRCNHYRQLLMRKWRKAPCGAQTNQLGQSQRGLSHFQIAWTTVTALVGGTVLLALEVWSSDMKKLRGHVNHRTRGGCWNEGGLWNKQKHKKPGPAYKSKFNQRA